VTAMATGGLAVGDTTLEEEARVFSQTARGKDDKTQESISPGSVEASVVDPDGRPG